MKALPNRQFCAHLDRRQAFLHPAPKGILRREIHFQSQLSVTNCEHGTREYLLWETQLSPKFCLDVLESLIALLR